MSATAPVRSVLPPDIRARKGTAPLVVLTAYTTPVARLVDAHCDIALVGDSVGMVLHGMPSTLGVTMEMMILHGRAVVRGLSKAMAVIDRPPADGPNSIRRFCTSGSAKVRPRRMPAMPNSFEKVRMTMMSLRLPISEAALGASEKWI